MTVVVSRGLGRVVAGTDPHLTTPRRGGTRAADGANALDEPADDTHAAPGGTSLLMTMPRPRDRTARFDAR